MSIGAKIKQHRRILRITQEELARNMNVTAQAVSKWELEESMPDISLLVPLAAFFETTVDVLLSGTQGQGRVRGMAMGHIAPVC